MNFEYIVHRVSPTLRRIAHRLNGRFSFMDEDDLFQEALLHLWVECGKGELADKTESYILQGCYFYLKNYIRKVQDHAILLSLSSSIDDEGTPLQEVLMMEDESSFDYAESRMEVEAMEEQGMTEREKEVLSLALEGLTTREIGNKLGVSHVSVVKVRNRIKEKYGRIHETNGSRLVAHGS